MKTDREVEEQIRRFYSYLNGASSSQADEIIGSIKALYWVLLDTNIKKCK